MGNQITMINNASDVVGSFHDPEVSKKYGISGSVVPGLTVLCRALRQNADVDSNWFSGKDISAKFAKPTLDQMDVEVSSTGPELTVVSVSDQNVRVRISLAETNNLVSITPFEPTQPLLPASEVPERRLLSAEAFERYVGRVNADDVSDYLAAIGGHPGRLETEKMVDPVILMRSYLRVLDRDGFLNFLGPSIHTATEAHVYSLLPFGGEFALTGRVDSLFQRRGRGYVKYLFHWSEVNSGVPLLAMAHTEIYRSS